MGRKTEKRKTLWECGVAACVKVMSEGTGNKKRIIVSDGTSEVCFIPKDFNVFKKAIRKGDL